MKVSITMMHAVILVAALTSVGADHNCPFDRVYKECGSACSPTCAERDENQICLGACVPGCFCPSGLYATEDGGCVQEEECPSSCPNGMVHKKCGSSCPRTCDDDGFGICITPCQEGCFCPPGRVTNGDICILPEECTNSSSCIVKGVEYSDGESFPSIDGCNQCACDDGEVTCTTMSCLRTYSGVLHMCKVGDLEVFQKQNYNDGCTVCKCTKSKRLDCLVPQRQCADPVYKSYDITMTFSVDYDSVVTDVDRFKDSVRNSLFNKYGATHNFLKAQISDIEVSRGSVVVVVTLEDSKEYQQSANITILLVQMEEDVNIGSLIITHDGTDLTPATDFIYSKYDDDDDDDDHDHDDDDDDDHDHDDDDHDHDDDDHDHDDDDNDDHDHDHDHDIIYVVVAIVVVILVLVIIVFIAIIVVVICNTRTFTFNNTKSFSIHRSPTSENEYELKQELQEKA